MRNIKLTGAVNFEAVVVSWMKENGLDEIVFVASNSKKYFGKYGVLVEYWYDGSIHWYEKPRKVAKLISEYLNTAEVIINTHTYEDDDGYDCSYNVLYFFDKPYRVVKEETYDNDGNVYSNKLIILSNGQLYDVTDHHWFSMANSKKLKKAIKSGYFYDNTNAWDRDCYDTEQATLEKLEKEAMRKLIRSSVDQLLVNEEFKHKVEQIAFWINTDEELLDSDRVSNEEAIKNYMYGYTPSYIQYSIYQDLAFMYVDVDSKPAYVKHLVKNKVEYDYASRIQLSGTESLQVLRKNFPKLDKEISGRVGVDPFCSTTMEELEDTALVGSNFSWSRALSDLYDKLGLKCLGKPWHEVLM